MANILLPSVLRPISIAPRLVTPAQRNRSEFTKSSKIILGPGKEFWTAKAVFRTLATEGEIRQARAFFYGLRGMANTFDLPVTPTPQFNFVPTNLAVTNNVGTTSVAQGGGVYRVTKTGGVGAWDSDAVSAASMNSDFVIRVNPRQTTHDFMWGCDVNPTVSSSYVDIDRAVHCKNTGNIDIYEASALIASNISAYTAADYLFMKRVGTAITLHKGATPDIGAAALIHTFTPDGGIKALTRRFLHPAGLPTFR